MAKAGSVQKTVVRGAQTKSKERGVWQWLERERGVVWETPLIPDGDWCVATVKRSFSKDGGKWWYYGYRSGKILGKRDTPEGAQKLVESGKADDRKDAVSAFVSDGDLNIPMFLRLTKIEQEQVRQHYKHHVPPAVAIAKFEKVARERGYQSAADVKDPGTVKLLNELAAKERAPSVDGARPARSGGGSSNTTKAERASVEFKETGKLSRLREGNPKKEGSAAYRRWALMFECCAKGSTVKEFLAAGGNPETLKNACLKGWAEVK